MKKLKQILTLFLLMFYTIVSAQRLIIGEIKDDSIPRVVTEDLLHIGGGSVQVSGRVISLGVDSIENHGFMVDKSQTFINPIIIDLGPKSNPGFFAGKATGLSIKSQYYVKSFVKSKGNLFFGETVSFKTSNPFINDFFPKVGIPGEPLRKNAFSVFFDDVGGKPPQAYKLSVIGIPFPALSYSFKF